MVYSSIEIALFFTRGIRRWSAYSTLQGAALLPETVHRTGCPAYPPPTKRYAPILLSVDFLFFLYAFHAAISIRYWFAIDIAIRYRYRYRSYRACSIASSDSDSERTTTPVAAWLR
uniref:Uncharacterized protein n=2 Tax=Candidatus Kentrum sp. FM TaxID=2126340 RepID=A0A450X3M5_9GAMM|nr:MAG: hypothetical protein BECKFM1743B_GA0114221_109561 [Candidatus Kentron sp. FM]